MLYHVIVEGGTVTGAGMSDGKILGWLQATGNIGLIVGLVLVGVQINQSTQIAKLQMTHDGWLAS